MEYLKIAGKTFTYCMATIGTVVTVIGVAAERNKAKQGNGSLFFRSKQRLETN